MVSSIRRRCRRACVAILLVGSATSMAQNASTPSPVGLQDAIVRSLQNNPDLMAFGYELQAQLGRIRLAGARPNPEVGVLVENALGTGNRSGVDAAETTLSLGFLIEHGAR